MLQYFLLAFGSLFAIVDPLAALPAFLAMTTQDTVSERQRMALVACVTAGLVLAVFAAIGPAIFRFLGITMPAFQVAGGLIVLLTALDMLRAKRSPLKETTEETEAGMGKADIAITPLAIPMLSGPGAITTAILLESRAKNLVYDGVLFLLFLLVGFASYLIFRIAIKKAPKINPIAMNITTRLMGLMLAATAVQFIIDGAKKAFFH